MIEVRELAGADEAAALGHLTVAAYAALPEERFSDGYDAELRDVHTRAAAVTVLVAMAEDRLVGGVTYVPGLGPYAEFESADEAGIRMLAVDPTAQGRGVGEALVRACVDQARAARKSRVSLHTTPWMTAAHRLYERLGFRRAPERDWAPVPDVPLLGYVLDLDRPPLGSEASEPAESSSVSRIP